MASLCVYLRVSLSIYNGLCKHNVIFKVHKLLQDIVWTQLLHLLQTFQIKATLNCKHPKQKPLKIKLFYKQMRVQDGLPDEESHLSRGVSIFNIKPCIKRFPCNDSK